MKIKSTIYILLIIFISSTAILGQERKPRKRKERITQRFAAGIVLGTNFSQIHGDTQSGFDKQGITGGIKVITQISPNLNLNVELLYVEKGSQFFNESAGIFGLKGDKKFISMNFIEVPFLLKFQPRPESILYLEGGISIGRKISSEIIDDFNISLTSKFKELEPEFISTDVSSLFGFGINIGKGASLGTRFSYSLTKSYDNPNLRNRNYNPTAPNSTEIAYLRNYAWHMILSYNIF